MKQTYVPVSEAKILVVGDVILDRYVHGETTRISPEAPVPVVLVKKTEERPGGAGNVALNISRLGIQVNLIGLTGEDPASDTLGQTLSENGVKCTFIRKKGFPTITKLRVLSQHQQLIRLDYEAHSVNADANALFEEFNKQVENVDLVVLSDYAKGSLSGVEAYISRCKSLNKKILIDPKSDDFDRYKGASLLTPNQKEFEKIVGKCFDTADLVKKARALCNKLELEALLVTRGEHGMTLIVADKETYHLTAEALEVYDVTGAGDTVIATMAAALASSCGYEDATRFANRAAGIVVGKLGTASVTVDELNDTSSQKEPGNPVLSGVPELIELVKKFRSGGESIVMTNGCFDLLHAGHVNYLQKARELGDHLIVAVNDDNSVRKLKGPGRPLNPVSHRMAVLGALKAVSYVIAFSEETPEKLIKEISPDVLVKGGDYQPEEVAGAKHVLQNGGTVKIIPLFENCSTSKIIKTAMQGDNLKK